MPFLKPLEKVTRMQRIENMAKRQGLRHAIFSVRGNKYIGEYEDDKKGGKGRLLTIKNTQYEGDWKANYKTGFGKSSYMIRNNVFVLEYVGWWLKNKKHGFGVRKYRNGEVYIGNHNMNLRHGYGHMWHKDGTFYAGCYVDGKRDGLGMLIEKNTDNRYEGSWKNDLKHGKGKYLHLATGQIQYGVWIDGICAYSTISDINYRQSAIASSHYPIIKCKLEDIIEVCHKRELLALKEFMDSCESFMDQSIKSDDYF